MKRLIGGQPLYTKDEFSFSNASVLCVGNRGKSITYQIRTENGNIGVLKDDEVEYWFNLYPLNEEAVEPSVNNTPDGFSLSVAVAHAENIKKIIPADMYIFQGNDSRGTFNVSSKDWSRFSELLCL
ncbi:hypothetical protein [Pseudomonas sp. 460]|uniref:hypothetical protein n=1 Tax=Pseudomonas sp. 460 TaxID=2485142 RepID=UPI0010489025|nr:hypothetical protein [Pseudomonas sp. 460]TCV51498.1 hypothetical protein EDB99_107164 [Pseudomonas sp. 460]